MSGWVIILLLLLILITKTREKLTDFEQNVLQDRRNISASWRLNQFRNTNSFQENQKPYTLI